MPIVGIFRLISAFFPMLLMGISLVLIGASHGYFHYQLSLHGRIISGTVISKASHRQEIGYKFIDPRGHRRWSITSGTKEAYDLAQIGGPISITYLPSDPNVSEVTSGDCFPWVNYLVIGFLSSLGVIVFCLFLLRMALRKRRLLRTGRLVSAQVIAVETKGPRMVYSFTDANGNPITGKLNISGVDKPYWERNLHENIAVFYNPDNPKDHLMMLERPSGYPHLVSRTKAVQDWGRAIPILLCFVFIFVIVFSLWSLYPIFTQKVFVQMYAPYYPKLSFSYCIFFILVAVAGPGFDSILARDQRARLLTGFRTTAKSVFVDLNLKRKSKDDPRTRLSYQYTDQTGATYDGWASPTPKQIKAVNNLTMNLEVYYNPANPAEHTLGPA